MPQNLPLPSPVVSRARHCTGINFAAAYGQLSFAVHAKRASYDAPADA